MNGLIAFFDILGYQSFLENNLAAESTERVLQLINDIPPKTKSELSELWLSLFKEKDGVILKEVADALNLLIFSDTIVLSITYPTNVSREWKTEASGFLGAVAGKLCKNMFIEGLPVRGAIVEGEFIMKDFCLAGKAVVDAYKLCESLDFSGVVFGSSVYKENEKNLHTFDNEGSIFHHLTSLKNGKEERMFHMNWLVLMNQDEQNFLKADVETFVLRSFWAHNKDCPRGVDEKIKNTVKLIRRYLIQLERINVEIQSEK
jgi:hypothetical protein